MEVVKARGRKMGTNRTKILSHVRQAPERVRAAVKAKERTVNPDFEIGMKIPRLSLQVNNGTKAYRLSLTDENEFFLENQDGTRISLLESELFDILNEGFYH